METEIWNPIVGYEGFYEVSNKGRIRSVDRFVYQQDRLQLYRGCIMTPFKNNNGYLGIRLSRDNKKKSYSVHKLVALAFIPNPKNLPQINHKNEDKTCNEVENLEWCDASYNLTYGSLPERRREKMGKRICMYDLKGNYIRSFRSAAEAERIYKLKKNCISTCCRKRGYISGGYIWRLESETKCHPIKPLRYKNMVREVNQYDKDLNLIATYKSITEAAKAVGGHGENISFCCRHKGIKACGFYWAFAGEQPQKKKTRTVLQYDKEGLLIAKHEDLNAAALSLGSKSKKPGIKQCIYGKNTYAYGFIWKYA